MSHLAHRAALRRGVLGGLGAIALLAAGSPAASAAKLTLTYQCTFPVTGEQPVTMELSGAFPSTELQGVPTAPVELEARITAGGDALTGYRLLGAATIEGSASVGVRVTAPNFALPVKVPATVPVTPVPATGPLVFTARGTVPSLQFPSLGTGSIAIEQVSLRLVARRADGIILQPVPAPGVDDLPAEIPCRLSPATLDPTLTTFDISGDDFSPSVPGAPRLTARTTTSLTLAWDASTDPFGGSGNLEYEVWGATSITPDGQPVGKTLLATTPSPGAILTGLGPGTTYTVVVRAVSARGQSEFTSPVPFTTEPPIGIEPFHYDLAGAAVLKTLTKGTVPLTGSLADAKLTIATGAMSANLRLDPVRANLITLGFLPISAQLAFTSTAPTTGLLRDGVLSTNSKVRIKFSHVSLMGLQLFVASNCQTKTVSNIALKSTDTFGPLTGGSLAGTFAMSDLTGCGTLNGLVSSLTAGKGNAIAVKLTPQA